MADPDMDEDLFADLYDGEADDPAPPSKAPEPEAKLEPEPAGAAEPIGSAKEEPQGEDVNVQTELDLPLQEAQREQPAPPSHDDDYDRPLQIKEDGKMFIGGLNWETTDQSLKDYFSQFGEVVECTVMRDGATGRSRGFGFLTFKDPKTVNIVMVKEHQLDGKLIDPKRAIPREEQERTAKIFVGGVSQECTEMEFKEFFMNYGRVLDATLMMDKNTGRPRGFGFVTFDSEAAVDRTLEQPLAIHNKYVEIKRAEPRGNVRDDDGGAPGKFSGRGGRGGGYGGGGGFGNHGGNQMDQNAGNGVGPNNMSASQMAQSWARMQQWYQMMQQQMAASQMVNMQNNPAMMQQMMAARGMNPAMMQQMQGGGGGGSPVNGGQGGLNAQEQLMFEQQKYEAQQQARMRQGNFQGGNTWDGMYDGEPAPANMRGGFGGPRGGRGGAGGARSSQTPQPTPNAPAGAPTGPKNAGIPGANYRGGGRGGRRGYHPYQRGGN